MLLSSGMKIERMRARCDGVRSHQAGITRCSRSVSRSMLYADMANADKVSVGTTMRGSSVFCMEVFLWLLDEVADHDRTDEEDERFPYDHRVSQ